MTQPKIESNINIKVLQQKFDAFRVFGDERDLELIDVRPNQGGPNCEVPIKASYLYPELQADPKNKTYISPECVQKALVKFLSYKFRNWTEVVTYRRIEDEKGDNEYNSCVLPLSTYTYLLNARRYNPPKAKELARRMVKNMVTIQDYRFGIITEGQFEYEMRKAQEEHRMEIESPRSLLQHKQDNEMVLDHIEKYVGKIRKSIHDQYFDKAPLSVHLIPEVHGQKNSALVTSGLSFLPMNPPEPMEFFRFSEFVIKLPLDWPLPLDKLKDDDFAWPIKELFNLMIYIHKRRQWISDMHTYGNGNPPLPYASNTGFCGFLFMFPLLNFPPEFCELRIDDNKSVIFLQLVPLYKEEIDYVISQADPTIILERFKEHGIPDYVDITRKNMFKPTIPSAVPTKTIGNLCPYCNTVLRRMSVEGVRCPSCKRLVVFSNEDELLSIDVPEELPTFPSQDMKRAEQLLLKGIHFFEQSKWESALECFNKGIELNPSEKRLWSFKLEVLYKLERFDEIDDCAVDALGWILKQSKKKE